MRVCLLILAVFFSQLSHAQVIRGTVTDDASGTPVSFATVTVLNTDPVIGATTDSAGNFLLSGVPIGRCDIAVSCMGYEPVTIKEVVVSSAKEVFLQIAIKEQSKKLGEVVIRSKTSKEKPLNRMATVSARMLSVDEAKRYAGGFDDPARLASAFAGVASNVGNNGIVVRGNAPQYLQWKMEGIEIPNPNHFADLSVFGGGGLTALSSHLLANSDFFTGAFPAEYSNALSGVFDIFMRTGNNKKHEHSLQIGAIGVDASSEGPFKKGGNSSYLFNYRYSTLALAAPLLPENAGGVRYQDLSFKLNFPTKKAGTFSIWGIGLQDRSGQQAKTDSTLWQYASDREQQDVKQYMGAGGLTHKYFIGNSAYVKTTFGATVRSVDLTTDLLTDALKFTPKNKIVNKDMNMVLTSFINKKISAAHTNRTGVILTGLGYDMNIQNADPLDSKLKTVAQKDGYSALMAAYTESSVNLRDDLSMNAGITSQVFTLNGKYTVEPRLGLKWQFSENQALGLAGGLHSRLERLAYYFAAPTAGNYINKDMDFTKAMHLVSSYDINLSQNLHLKVEAYFQHLYSVPVVAGTPISLLNMNNDWFFSQALVNNGEGRNYGIDITFEKYLSKGYYYLLTGSLFESKYVGGDGSWRDTRFNRNYLCNVLVGKEWVMGAQRKTVLGLSTRFTYQGGDRYTPVNVAASQLAKTVVYDDAKAFSSQLPSTFTTHFTASCKLNRKKKVHEFALKMINLTQQADFFGFNYNYINNTVDKHQEVVFIPNVSYKIEF